VTRYSGLVHKRVSAESLCVDSGGYDVRSGDRQACSRRMRMGPIVVQIKTARARSAEAAAVRWNFEASKRPLSDFVAQEAQKSFAYN